MGHPVRKALTVSALVAGAAAAGYYFYGSEDAKKHRKVAAKWAHTFKKEVSSQVAMAKKIDRATVSAVVTKATVAFKKQMPHVDAKELKALGAELTQHWSKLAADASKTAKSTMKSAKKTVKKVAKSIQK